MIKNRNYNGNTNRVILRKLKKICDAKLRNEKKIMAAFAKNGEVSFYENTDFFGFVDELSKVLTLKSEEEIKQYITEYYQKRLNQYFENSLKIFTVSFSGDKLNEYLSDYLLIDLINFIKDNNITFPNEDEMTRLEIAAEAKRIAAISLSDVNSKQEATMQDVALEILQFSEEIIKSRKRRNPKDISYEGCFERLWIENDEFIGNILYSDTYGDFCDYACTITDIKKSDDVKVISLIYCANGTPIVRTLRSVTQEPNLNKYLITIHKGIVEMAKQEGIEFETEIDYQKIS